MKILPSLEMKNDQIVYRLRFLNTLTENSNTRKYLCSKEWHLKFYNFIKINEQKGPFLIKQKIEIEIIKMIVEFIKNIILNSEENEVSKFVTVLIQDIQQLGAKRDMIFVTNLLVPLLNAETYIPVSFFIYDKEKNSWILDFKSKLEQKLTI